MTIKEALKEICDEQIPKEVNGVTTKYSIREYRSVIGNRVVEISILPTNISKEDIEVVLRYSDEFYMNYDYCVGSLGYARLGDDMRYLLCWYIRNINKLLIERRTKMAETYMTRAEFVDFMDKFEAKYREIEKTYDRIEDIVSPEFFYSHDYMRFVIELLAQRVGTTQAELDWWIFEADFGKKEGFGEVSWEDLSGEEHEMLLKDSGDFYDYIVATR